MQSYYVILKTWYTLGLTCTLETKFRISILHSLRLPSSPFPSFRAKLWPTLSFCKTRHGQIQASTCLWSKGLIPLAWKSKTIPILLPFPNLSLLQGWRTTFCLLESILVFRAKVKVHACRGARHCDLIPQNTRLTLGTQTFFLIWHKPITHFLQSTTG